LKNTNIMKVGGDSGHTIQFSAVSLTLTAQTLKMAAAIAIRTARCSEAMILAGRFM